MAGNFTPSQAEISFTNAVFARSDPNNRGMLTRDVAARLMNGSKLPTHVLSEIWLLADGDQNGWLTKKSFSIVLRLMGHAQRGASISEALLSKPGALPVLEGVSLPVVQHNTGSSLPNLTLTQVPPITEQDRLKSQRFFAQCSPVNGLLSGDKARDVFFKSQLPVEVLGRIWDLADTQNRGALDVTDFTIGMHFIRAMMNLQIRSIPSTLPPGLYEQAGGSPKPNVSSFSQFLSPSLPPRGPLVSQISGSAPPVTAAATGPRLPARPQSNLLGADVRQTPPFRTLVWDVSTAEKASADQHFDQLDPDNQGYLTAQAVYPFFLLSRLDPGTLVRVWELIDTNNGKITRDYFAVGMHLIQGKLAGREIPDTLPSTLVPPANRIATSRNGPANDPFNVTTSPFAALSNPAPESRDLLWDTPPSSPFQSSSFQLPPVTLQPQATGPSRSNSYPTTASPTSNRFEPVTSSFGSTALPKNLLEDDEDYSHKLSQLSEQSTGIGNTQNQLNSTTRSLETVKAERAALETKLANQAAQLSALQTQLFSAKAAYETETTLLTTLQGRATSQTADLQKTRESLITAESDLSALRVEKAEVGGMLLRDKEDVRDLHRKMAELGQETEALKAEVEKLKKHAKQQKGLLAIARKQLSSKEAEKARMEQELQEAKEEVALVIKEKENAESEAAIDSSPNYMPGAFNMPEPTRADSLILAASLPLPTTPEPRNSDPPPGKSSNPFDRITRSSTPSRSQSSFTPFDDFFSPGSSQNGAVESGEPASPATHDPFWLQEADPASLGQNAAPSLARPAPPTSATVISSPQNDLAVLEKKEEVSTAVSQMPKDSLPARQGTIEEAAQKFPDLDAIPTEFASASATEVSPTGPIVPRTEDSPLMSRIQELDVDISDSDSHDDGPTRSGAVGSGEVKRETSPVDDKAAPESNVFQLSDEPKSDIFNAVTQLPVPTSIVDDAFSQIYSIPPTKPELSTVETGPKLGEPSATALPFIPSAGVDVFDEALGKLPPSGRPTNQISFETAFEDNFDFGPNFGTNQTQPSSDIIVAPAAPAAANGNAFADDLAFFIPQTTNGTSTLLDLSNTSPAKQKTFSDFFEPIAESSTSHAKDAQVVMGVATEVPPLPVLESSAKSQDKTEERPDERVERVEEPASPPASPQPTAYTSSAPHSPDSARSTILSRRKTMSTPTEGRKSRPSTASGKETSTQPEKTGLKLGLRLFGKKRKDTKERPQSQWVSPPPELPPSSPDDVPPVKQLCNMGFPRELVIATLEEHSYNVERALNVLLSQAPT